jgi:Uma2 family endonuclease
VKTALKLGPADKGRPMTFEELCAADTQEGYKYELIHGRLDVSPLPDPPANAIEDWLFDKLKEYSRQHPDVINFVTNKARVYVGEREDVSYPEPDISAFKNFPLERRFSMRWREVSPVLAVEVIDPDNPEKDTVRNVEVYLAVASIREYWIIDIRKGAATPSLIVRRRHGDKWRKKTVNFGKKYETDLLPGFELVVDPKT